MQQIGKIPVENPLDQLHSSHVRQAHVVPMLLDQILY